MWMPIPPPTPLVPLIPAKVMRLFIPAKGEKRAWLCTAFGFAGLFWALFNSIGRRRWADRWVTSDQEWFGVFFALVCTVAFLACPRYPITLKVLTFLFLVGATRLAVSALVFRLTQHDAWRYFEMCLDAGFC